MPTVKASSETKSQPKVVPKLVFTMEQSLKFQLQTAPTVPNESDIWKTRAWIQILILLSY